MSVNPRNEIAKDASVLGWLTEESGQAAVEYGTIAYFILIVAFVVGRPMWIALAMALQLYFDSFFFLLRLPIP